MPKMSTVYDSLFCRVTRFFIHAVQGDCTVQCCQRGNLWCLYGLL